MKNTLTICILCLGLGFGAAWLLKPDDNTEEETVTKKGEQTKPAPVGTKSNRVPTGDSPSKSEREETEDRRIVINGQEIDPDNTEMREQMRRGRDRWRDMMANR